MKSLIREGRAWEIAPLPEDSLLQEIETSLSCSHAFALVLARRSQENWHGLIDPGLASMHSPFDILDMEKGVARLIRAIEEKERIFIHGDFDVDGLTGAAVLYQGLLSLLPPGRLKVEVGDRAHGHGLSRDFVHRAIDEKFSLVITVDCGISNNEEIDALREAGIDTIVTDHHIPPPILPQAQAIIDPHREDDSYPNPHLAGVGVAYKLIAALYKKLGRPAPHHFLDLVALGTIADMVPLADRGEVENRALVREGFSLLARGEGSSLGLRVLLKKLSVNPKRITASDIGYLIAPKLNAANRAGDPKVAFLLLTTTVPQRAEYLIEILLDYNRDREIAQKDLIAQAEEQLAENGANPYEDGIIILAGKYWNEGILGLAASNLTDRYRVPAIIISQGNQTSRASCRSVDGFDLADCLSAHSHLFLQYGGHKMAAGFSIANETLPELRENLLSYAAKQGTGIKSVPPRTIDAVVTVGEINMRFYTNIRSLSPYGQGNPDPLFLLRNCTFNDLSLVGARKQHLKGAVVQDGLSLPFIAFRMGKHIDTFEQAYSPSTGDTKPHRAALIFRARFDEWKGSVQMEVADLVID
ncbi:MAG: single-stranded-DNA-specific exonuclease RecJ [Candidatus Bipolaricaulota bacterium]|nr:single-stranded-DNA-specific exonuclease RecJ [Candidatus Bipolaricaulota bacterium]